MIKKYKVQDFKNEIYEIKRIIHECNLSYSQLQSLLKVNLNTLKKILNFKQKYTRINIIALRDNLIKQILSKKSGIKGLNEAEFFELFEIKLNNRIVKQYIITIAYLISLLKKIENPLKTLSTIIPVYPKNLKLLSKAIKMMQEHNIIVVSNNVIEINFKYNICLSSKKQSRIAKKAFYYFAKDHKYNYYNNLVFEFNLKTNEREIYLLKLIKYYYKNENYDKVFNIFNSYFQYLKKNNKKKSGSFKLLYNSFVANYFYFRGMYIKALCYLNYILNYFKIKNNFIEVKLNEDFEFESIDNYFDIYNEEANFAKSLVYNNIIQLSSIYFRFKMFPHFFRLLSYIKVNMNNINLFKLYMFDGLYLFISFYGNNFLLDELIEIIDKIKHPDKNYFLLKYMQRKFIIEKERNKLNKINQKYKNYLFSKKHYDSYVYNFYERIIDSNIMQSKYFNAIYLNFYLMGKNRSNNYFFEAILNFFLIFILILKNCKTDILDISLDFFINKSNTNRSYIKNIIIRYEKILNIEQLIDNILFYLTKSKILSKNRALLFKKGKLLDILKRIKMKNFLFIIFNLSLYIFKDLQEKIYTFYMDFQKCKIEFLNLIKKDLRNQGVHNLHYNDLLKLFFNKGNLGLIFHLNRGDNGYFKYEIYLLEFIFYIRILNNFSAYIHDKNEINNLTENNKARDCFEVLSMKKINKVEDLLLLFKKNKNAFKMFNKIIENNDLFKNFIKNYIENTLDKSIYNRFSNLENDVESNVKSNIDQQKKMDITGLKNNKGKSTMINKHKLNITEEFKKILNCESNLKISKKNFIRYFKLKLLE